MAGNSPAFQFYANDWLSSPKINMMTPAQEGAYIRLLAYAWADPECSLPDDDEALAKLSRLGEGWLKGGSTILRECFVQHPKINGRIINKRLLFERKKQEKWRTKSRDGGINSGIARRKVPKGGSVLVQPLGQPNTNQRPTLHSSSSSSFSERKDLKPPFNSPPQGGAVSDIPVKGRKNKKPELHPDAKEVAEAYREIRGDGIAAGVHNVSSWLRDGETKGSLLAAIHHYREVALDRDAKYRKKLGNFFGRDAPEFRDWIAGPPASEDSTAYIREWRAKQDALEGAKS